jgi:gag-polyprotein putative aspartyl protease
MILNVPYRSMQRMAEVKTLVDSGATENLMDTSTASFLNVALQKLPLPRTITNADGSANTAEALTHYCELRIRQGDKEEVQNFYVSNLGSDRIILGYPWLKVFQPKFDWETSWLNGPPVQLEAKWYDRVKKRQERMIVRRARVDPAWEEGDEIILVSKVNMAQQWAEKANKDKEKVEIPPQYRDFADVFSKEGAKRFPPSRPEDHAIKLKPEAPDVINCKVYPLTAVEKQATKEWIDEHEQKTTLKNPTPPGRRPGSSSKRKMVVFVPSKTIVKSTSGQSEMSIPCQG